MIQPVLRRAFRYRLYPTPEQERSLTEHASVCRFIWNLALEQRSKYWRTAQRTGVRLNSFTQGLELTQLRAEHDWIAACPTTPQCQTLRDLDRAFLAFHAGRASHPAFKSKAGRQSFRHKGRDTSITRCNDKWSLIRVPKIGLVRLRRTREWVGRIVSATFSRDALGWHVALACEMDHTPPINALPAVGIDRGVANTLALSTGELLSVTDVAVLERRKRKAQRILARRQRGSKRYASQRRRLSRATAKIARVRAHWRHEVTTALVARFGFVALEALRTGAMTRAGRGKRGLNRSILEQGWGGFEVAIAYKLEERGGTLVKVNPAYTSQQCSDCGIVDRGSRESQARFVCRSCGLEIHADHNAAINILRRSTASVEVPGYRTEEARPQTLAA